MSFVVDQVRRIDSQLDRLQLSGLPAAIPEDDVSVTSAEARVLANRTVQDVSPRVNHLQSLIKSLSATSAPEGDLVSISRILDTLRHADIKTECRACLDVDDETPLLERSDNDPQDISKIPRKPDPTYEHELEWLLVSKATTQVYGHVLNTILEQTIPLSDDIWYWDDILGSYRHAGLYSIQTSPLRLWDLSWQLKEDISTRGWNLAHGWRQFYNVVKQALRDRAHTVAFIQRQALSPLALVRDEAQRKQVKLKRTKQVNANALGVLLGEGLKHENIEEEGLNTPTGEFSTSEHRHKWKSNITRTIGLMDALLVKASDTRLALADFEDAIATTTQRDAIYEHPSRNGDRVAMHVKPEDVCTRLQKLVRERLPEYRVTLEAQVRKNGRPSPIIRYWLPATALLISSSTILRILVNRKADILTWIQELGSTVMDFWSNWVVEPARKLIGTIRHDEAAEISLMSKRSLEGDRESLERMVVDFAVDNPETGNMTELEVADLRAKIKEGDLTPVLRAYEKDLRRPLIGAVRGNLIRALLIQMQKTKVDIEIAMGGIDSLLKSQELLFGFLGVTPGILVCIGASRWLRSLSGNRKGSRRGQQQGKMLRELRNIDRIITLAAPFVHESGTPEEFKELSYKDHGLLLCEVHVLRQTASEVLPGHVFRDFLEEIQDLIDIRTGVEKQQKVVDRMRWAYQRYF